MVDEDACQLDSLMETVLSLRLISAGPLQHPGGCREPAGHGGAYRGRPRQMSCESMRAEDGLIAVQVAYSGGSTQGGSSGAPLIDAQSQLIVGVLSGGHASCDDTNAFDYFGRLAVVRLHLPHFVLEMGMPCHSLEQWSLVLQDVSWQHQGCGGTIDRCGEALKPAVHAL